MNYKSPNNLLNQASNQTTNLSSHSFYSPSYDDDGELSTPSMQSQIDLLARLRIIEQLQGFCLPRFQSSVPDDLVTDILNWMCLCFCPNPTSDDVSIALALYGGQITVYIGNTPNSPSISSLQLTKNIFKAVLKQVLRRGGDHYDPHPSAHPTPAATHLFFRMVINIGWKRIQRKIFLLCNTSGDSEQTGLRFVSLVKFWLRYYRPSGEQSRAFVTKTLAFCGDISATTDYMVQSFLVILEQAGMCMDDMEDEQRFRYLVSLMTACEMFVKSTFFEDLLNHHTFRMTLEQADRIFLHTLLRRFSHIASYKTGASKFAIIGVPFIHEVLGASGIQSFLEDKPRGGIVFELISEYQERSPRSPPNDRSAEPELPPNDNDHSKLGCKHPLAVPGPAMLAATPSSRNIRSYRWQESPLEFLPSTLGLCDHSGSGSRMKVPQGESGGDDNSDEYYYPYSEPHSRGGSTDTDTSCESSESTASITSTVSSGSSGSRNGSTEENDHHYTTNKNKSTNRTVNKELRFLDRQLQLKLVSSDVISEAWVPGDIVTVKNHSVLQLIHHLDGREVEAMAQTVGTSKPICWMCREYIKCLEKWYSVREDQADKYDDEHGVEGYLNSRNGPATAEREEKFDKKWFISKGSGKVRHDWLIPPEAPPEVVDALVEDAQKEMERVVEEGAFDSYLKPEA